tara:strand:+ start:181 stop:462 length:282 start_codon:yes stop_codon:yes gene_type:complete
MAYGLQIWDASGNVRMDTTDREVRFVAYYTGSTAANSSTTISVAGLSNDGTWGLNDTAYGNVDASLSIGSGEFTHTNSNSFNAVNYSIQVFRI